MIFDLTGKVALITGSSKGIGKAIAEQMALFGARVVISSRKADICDTVAAEINEKTKNQVGEAVSIPCNISSKEQLQTLVDKTREHYDKIDVLICNAAVNPFFGSSADIPDSAFEKILDCNIKSNHWLCQMVMPEMVDRKDGVVIIVSSVGGFRGSSNLGTYAISKAADLAMVRNLAIEYGPYNIRTNAICPGLIRTNFARALWEDEETLKQRNERVPLGRIGEPEEVAGAAVFMASDAGKYMTGQYIILDGGEMLV